MINLGLCHKGWRVIFAAAARFRKTSAEPALDVTRLSGGTFLQATSR